MLSLVQFLEEIDHNNQMVVMSAEDVQQLAERFGDRVRSIGIWNKTTDGSIEIPMANIVAAVKGLANRELQEALAELRAPHRLSKVLSDSSAARRLIDTLADLQQEQFGDRVERYQSATDPVEVEQLRARISRELFGE